MTVPSNLYQVGTIFTVTTETFLEVTQGIGLQGVPIYPFKKSSASQIDNIEASHMAVYNQADWQKILSSKPKY